MASLIGGPSTFTYSTAESTQGKTFGLGDVAEDQTGAEYRYVQAAAAITANDAVHISPAYQATALTTTLAKTAGSIGFAGQAFASAYYGWVLIAKGNPTLRVAASTTANAPLYASGTGGVLDSTLGSAAILGVKSASAGSAGGITLTAGCVAFPVVDDR
jgi:hypothetical protein